LTIGQRQRLSREEKGGRAGTSALTCQRFRSHHASQRRPTHSISPMRNRRVRGPIDRRHQVAHPLEFL
jgi:hypothetical protein